ncbi:unnamed protein product [Blepharisma stoltei]|uniref:non-specific serine/threonine protein kinase n=1 Tax=Blepharisma stoltei TaxID=1481888 RepID=A0AAU9JM57_9CILI|nr:unnamed protein product [Blepharisma stoltei]
MEELGVAVVKELGRGTSGIVYKVQHQGNGRFYVIKAIDLSNLSKNKQNKAEKEVEILSTVSHEHIIRYYNSIIKDETLFILMEYASGGDLQSFISKTKEKRKGIDESQLWTWAYEICLAVNYLHSNNILHRDIKCMNIFLDNEKRIKIGDLGLSKMTRTKQMHTSIVGTPLYLSPEQVRRHPYGNKADIWAIGCVLYNIAALDLPFLGDNLITLGYNILNKAPRQLPARYSPKLVSFIMKFLDKNSYKRPEIKEALTEVPLFIKKLYRKPIMQPDPRNCYKTENSILSTNITTNESTTKISQETHQLSRVLSQPPETTFKSQLRMQLAPENIVSNVRPMTQGNHRSYFSFKDRPETVANETQRPRMNVSKIADEDETPCNDEPVVPRSYFNVIRPQTSEIVQGEFLRQRGSLSIANITPAPLRPETAGRPYVEEKCVIHIRPRATIKDLARVI